MKKKIWQKLLKWYFIMYLLLSAFGYFRGVYKFVKCDFEAPYKSEIIYGAGIASGYGIFIGYIDIQDGKTERIEGPIK